VSAWVSVSLVLGVRGSTRRVSTSPQEEEGEEEWRICIPRRSRRKKNYAGSRSKLVVGLKEQNDLGRERASY
jgi:hypothetical protein